MGGPESLQFSCGGDDETGSDDQSNDQAKELEENVREKHAERLNNVGALTAEAEDGATLDVVKAKENAEVLTIESSPKWGGTLIEEEQEKTEIEDIPSTSATDIEIHAPRKKRRRSKEEI